ncbi:MAG: hypothetical protein U5L00_18945 [Desulfovermiculus sp.]|nr:hypothetical protein [Desulfovermiculus sp.]
MDITSISKQAFIFNPGAQRSAPAICFLDHQFVVNEKILVLLPPLADRPHGQNDWIIAGEAGFKDFPGMIVS